MRSKKDDTTRYQRKWYQENRERVRLRSKEWYQENRKRVLEKQKTYQKENPEKVRERHAKYYKKNLIKHRQDGVKRRLARTLMSVGLTIDQHARLMIDQDGRCAICRRRPGKTRLCIDHNHRTGRARGLLCGQCNHALGLLQDNMDVVWKAFWYLEKHQ